MKGVVALRAEPDTDWLRRYDAGGGLQNLPCLLAPLGLHVVIVTLGIGFGGITPYEREPSELVAVDRIFDRRIPLAEHSLPPAVESAALSRSRRTDPKTSSASRLELPSQDVLVRPARMLANAALDVPFSRQARVALRMLGTEDRIEQLCDVGAMEQIEAWRLKEYRPELLVAYAFKDTVFAERVVTAEGAAFKSKSNWYRLTFDCGVSPDLERVVAFEFQVGKIVRRHLLTQYDLEAGNVSME